MAVEQEKDALNAPWHRPDLKYRNAPNMPACVRSSVDSQLMDVDPWPHYFLGTSNSSPSSIYLFTRCSLSSHRMSSLLRRYLGSCSLPGVIPFPALSPFKACS